jgi:hypothetical protein
VPLHDDTGLGAAHLGVPGPIGVQHPPAASSSSVSSPKYKTFPDVADDTFYVAASASSSRVPSRARMRRLRLTEVIN